MLFGSTGGISIVSICVATVATAFCCLSIFCFLGKDKSKRLERESKRKVCRCQCFFEGNSNISHPNGILEKHEISSSLHDRQTGGSMMEQLVPEIRTHALSYLDYPSLCRLSMTNSWMRRAANDDGAWKALYHKDFTLEQDTIIPLNGWKSYYAATKAVIDVNSDFFKFIRERSMSSMSRLWLHADYVKCIHGSGELFTGYDAVMESWALAFNWVPGINFQVRDVCARVLTDTAWLNMKAYVDVDSGPFHITNVFELHNDQWNMVHHHSSVMLIDGDVGPGGHHNIFG